MELLKNKLKDLAVIIIAIVLLILGTKFDFRFSDNIYSDNNWLNFFVAAIAKMPVYYATMYVCVALFVLALAKENKVEKYLMASIYAVGAFVSGMLMFEDVVETFMDGIFKYLIAFAIGALLAGYLFYVLKDKNKETFLSQKKEMLVIVISVALIVIATALLKEVIERTRFEDLLMQQGSFTPWYKKGTGGDSMPSGHTAMVVALFAVIPYLKKIDLFKGKNYLYYPIICVFALCVALSRISMGKHFLSDTAVAMIVAFVISKAVTWCLLGFKEDKLEIKEGSLLAKL